MLWVAVAYVAGLGTPLAVVSLWDQISPGRTWECWQHDFVSGDLYKTPRIVSRARWYWHRAAHRLGVAR